MKLPRILSSWDENQRASAVKIAGLCVAALALFVLIGSVSYMLHWQQDMSFEPGEKVANAAGTLGYRTGKFLVCDFLGLGSFALLVILVAVSVRLLTGRWAGSILKTVLLTISGAFIASLFFAFAGKLAGLSNAFGGGLGGACGEAVVSWSLTVLGAFITAIVLILLVALWLFFCSRRFNRWLSGLWTKSEGDGEDDTVEGEPRPSRIRRERIKTKPEEEDDNKTQQAPAPVFVKDEIPEEEEPKVQEIKPESGAKGPDAAVPEEGNPDLDPITVQRDDTLDAEPKKPLQPINNRLDPPDGLPKFNFPPSLDLLDAHDNNRHEVSTEELVRNRNKIRAALANYKIQVNDVTAIVAHLGGGITVTLHRNGEVIDTNNGLGGDGPFTPERAGSCPAFSLIEMCYSGKYTEKEAKKRVLGQGGAVAFFGTNDLSEIENRALAGDERCAVWMKAFSLNIAKYIASVAATVDGKVDVILLTGGTARSDMVCKDIERRCAFIAPVERYPGEHELESLAENGYRVLAGEAQILVYDKDGSPVKKVAKKNGTRVKSGISLSLRKA